MQPARVFDNLATQWVLGPPTRDGRVPLKGLNYAAVPVVLQLLEIPAAEHADIFQALRVMEGEALDMQWK